MNNVNPSIDQWVSFVFYGHCSRNLWISCSTLLHPDNFLEWIQEETRILDPWWQLPEFFGCVDRGWWQDSSQSEQPDKEPWCHHILRMREEYGTMILQPDSDLDNKCIVKNPPSCTCVVCLGYNTRPEASRRQCRPLSPHMRSSLRLSRVCVVLMQTVRRHQRVQEIVPALDVLLLQQWECYPSYII